MKFVEPWKILLHTGQFFDFVGLKKKNTIRHSTKRGTVRQDQLSTSEFRGNIKIYTYIV